MYQLEMYLIHLIIQGVSKISEKYKERDPGD